MSDKNVIYRVEAINDYGDDLEVKITTGNIIEIKQGGDVVLLLPSELWEISKAADKALY